MSLVLTRFRVHRLTGDPVDLIVMPADRMRAERHSTTLLAPTQRGRAGLENHAETWVMLWLWCAATRTGLTGDPFEVFADTVAGYERLGADGQPLDDDDEEAEELAVDPTQPGAPTTAPSSSPTTSGTSPGGWTPPVTPT